METFGNQIQRITKIIQATADKFGWKDKWNGWGKPHWVSPDGKRARGVGVGIIGNGDAGEDFNEAVVRIIPNPVTEHCKVILNMDIPESGMGQRSNICKMVAEVMNVPYEDVEITPIGTGSFNPNSFGLCGSRGTITYGRAACDAAEDVRQKLFDLALPILKVPTDTMELDDFGVRSMHMPERFVKWKHLIPEMLTLQGYGKHLETFGVPTCLITFVEVEVDLETGKFDVIKAVNGSDVGQVIDPAALEMQMQWSFWFC